MTLGGVQVRYVISSLPTTGLGIWMGREIKRKHRGERGK